MTLDPLDSLTDSDLRELAAIEDEFGPKNGIFAAGGLCDLRKAQHMNQYNPDWVSPPGETISDILSDRGLTTTQFAEAVQMDQMTAWGLYSGSTVIDDAIAVKLESFTGASREFWLTRERLYRESLSND